MLTSNLLLNFVFFYYLFVMHCKIEKNKNKLDINNTNYEKNALNLCKIQFMDKYINYGFLKKNFCGKIFS